MYKPVCDKLQVKPQQDRVELAASRYQNDNKSNHNSNKIHFMTHLSMCEATAAGSEHFHYSAFRLI